MKEGRLRGLRLDREKLHGDAAGRLPRHSSMKPALISLLLWTTAHFVIACGGLSGHTKHYSGIAETYLGQFNETGPSIVMITARDGTVKFWASRGLADLENPVALSADSVVRIASLTKQFTAVAILALIEDELLGLSDALADRLDKCPDAWESITIAQLLSHTSGLSGDMSPILEHLHEDFTPRELLQLFSGQSLASSPGERWRYSNLNYWILGVVIEELTGQPYTSTIDQRVLRPAGLENTRYGDTAPVIKRRVEGYVRTAEGDVMNAPYFSSTIGFAAGGYVSTPRDLAKWYAALSQGKIISYAMIQRALRPVFLEDGSNTRFGLGWSIDKIAGATVAHHGGSSIGFTGYVYWQPRDAVFSAVFTNDGSLSEPSCAAEALFRATQAEGGPRDQPAPPPILPGSRPMTGCKEARLWPISRPLPSNTERATADRFQPCHRQNGYSSRRASCGRPLIDSM